MSTPVTASASHRVPAIALRPRSTAAIALAVVAGLIAFAWPLLVTPGSSLSGNEAAPLILGGRVFGAGFGFVLGATTLFGSALFTGGVGPWLPYQMLGAAIVGLFAGLLPPLTGRWELAMLALYGAVSGVAYGVLQNLSFWPFGLGERTSLSFVAGAPIGENLHRFFVFSFSTSLGWDLVRGLTNVVMILVTGPAILATLRRAARRAHFGAVVEQRGTTVVEQRGTTVVEQRGTSG